MANINIDSRKKNTYDAIVIGSGISGGWSAKELCEKGYLLAEGIPLGQYFLLLSSI